MKKSFKLIFLVVAAILLLGLLAGCKTETYTVTFENCDVKAQKVAKGECAVAPYLEHDEKVRFAGWFSDEKCENGIFV